MNSLNITSPDIDGTAEMDWSWNFIPLVAFESNPSDKQRQYDTVDIVETEEIAELSEHIDNKKRHQRIWEVTTHMKTQEANTPYATLHFIVSDGSTANNDKDGIITIKDSSKFKAEVNYISNSKLSINFSRDDIGEGRTINFIANDNEQAWLDIEGDLKDIFCGCIKIKPCFCNRWTKVDSIISKKDFVGWDFSNCFDLATKQVQKKSGYTPYDRDSPEEIIVIYTDVLTAAPEFNDIDQIGAQKGNFIRGVKYLTDTIKDGIPVMVGVDYEVPDSLINFDKTTDHYIVIVGMGIDKNGCYFTFYDNRVNIADADRGTSQLNKLYCRCETSKLNGYYLGYDYTVTHIRKTKKI